MRYPVTFKLTAGHELVSSVAVDVPGLMSQGSTVYEAIKASESALKLYSDTQKTITDIEESGSAAEPFPVKMEIGEHKFEMFLVNGDEYTVTENGNIIYKTSDAVGTYALAEMFMAAVKAWITFDSEGREKDTSVDVMEVLKETVIPFLQDRPETETREV